MDELAGRYLTLSLRLGRLDGGLIDSYTGPARLLAAVNAEPRRTPEALVGEADRLVIDLAHEPTLPGDRADWLACQVRALRAIATEMGGEHLTLWDRVRRRLDCELPTDPRDEAERCREAVAVLVPGDGPIGDRVSSALAGTRVTTGRAVALFAEAVAHLRDATRVRFHLPESDDVTCVELAAARDGTQRWQAAYTHNTPTDGYRERIAIAFLGPVTVRDVVAAALGAAYPGVHTERAIKGALLVDQFGRGECAIAITGTPQAVVSAGAGGCAGLTLAGEVETLVEHLAGSAGVKAPSAALASAVHELADATAVGAVAVADAGGDVDAWLEDFSPRSREGRRQFSGELADPGTALRVLVPALGHRAVRDFLDKQATPIDGFRRLLTEQLTPSAMRERG